MPSSNVDEVYTTALSHFLGNIEMPRTDLSMTEWFEQKASFYPHEGQQQVIKAIEEGKRELDIIAGYRAGKCLAQGSRIVLTDGRLLPIEMIRPGDTVLSLGGDLRIHPAPVTAVQSMGIQPCYRLSLESGRSIVVTHEHPLYAQDGWTPLSELQTGDLIATPRRYPPLGTETIAPEEAAIVGYLLGDGSLTSTTGNGRGINRDDVIPSFPLHECYERLAQGIEGHPGRRCPYPDREGYALVRRARVSNIARDSAQAIAQHFGIGAALAFSDISWDRIRDIEPVGPVETWDIRVEGSHNYVAEDIFVHNSELTRQIAFYYVVGLAKRVWILGPTWDVVDRTFNPLWDMIAKSGVDIVQRQRESRFIRVASGGLVEGISWRTPEQIQAEGVHVVITDESQEMPSKIADLIRARLIGDWLWLRIGSPSQGGMSFYEEQAQATAATKLPTHALITWPTWLNPNEEVQQAVKIEKESLDYLKNVLGPEHAAYKQRKRRFDAMYGGQSMAPTDIAIPTFDRDIHVRQCPFDPDLPVYLGIDPGFYPSYYAVTVFQPHPWGTALGVENERSNELQELWQIDEIYVQHTVTDDVIKMCKEREWWKNVRSATIDVAARQRERQTGTSDLVIWQTKCHFPIAAEWVSVNDSLNTHRRWLAQNRLFHDEEKCPNTIREYLLHKVRARHEGDANDVEIARFNHSHKALSYMIVLQYGVHDGSLQPVSWTRQTSRASRRQWQVA